jgi:hypothetical protein
MDLSIIRDRCSLSESGCWEWRGATASGYPRAKINRKLVSVHRLAYELANPGSETKGKDVCHKCDNPRCCNPEHLFAGTRRENMLDCKAKGRLGTRPRKYDQQFIESVREMLSQGIPRREISRRLGWQWGSLYSFEKRYGLR